MPATATCTRWWCSHPATRTPAAAAFERIVDLAVDIGGTVTGERGVGTLKMRGLARELGPAVLGMHRAIKNALDPAGILNPGKVLPAGS